MKRIIYIIIILLFLLGIYGFYFNVKGLKINEYHIESKDIPDSFQELTFIHFSDLLYKSSYEKNDIDKLVEQINDIEANVIFFTGDLFYKNYKPTDEDIGYLKDTLKKINASLYKFAIIGENDKKYLDEYKSVLQDSNFILLDNSNFLLFYKDINPINIICIDTKKDVDKLLTPEVETNYNIVLTHKPDLIDDINVDNVDLVLAGHGLNGQIRIPYFGGIIKRSGSKKYVDNHYKVDNTELYISNGLGTLDYEIRLFNKPSINVYRLLKK